MVGPRRAQQVCGVSALGGGRVPSQPRRWWTGPGRAAVLAVLGLLLVVAPVDPAAGAPSAGLVAATGVPVVSEVSPSAGPVAGGNRVKVLGSGFRQVKSVKVGGVPASFKVKSGKRIVVTVPAGEVGTVHVRVRTAAGRSAKSPASRYRYLAAPTVTGLSPVSGPHTGGNRVVVRGKRLSGVTRVRFGTVDASSFRVNSVGEIVAVAPPGGPGRVHVRVEAAGGLSATSAASRYQYLDAVGLAAGSWHTCGLRVSGQMACWGDNFAGALGDGTTTDRHTPVAVTGLTDVIAATAGFGHTCALRINGHVACWGRNWYGQVGDNTTTHRQIPVAVTGLTDVTAVAANDQSQHTCALRSNGEVACWGYNEAGQLGDGTTTHRQTPVAVVDLTDATAITTGTYHTCALRGDGQVTCWGHNVEGQLGDGTTTDRHTPVAVVGITDATAIAAGENHSCALRSSGEVACWGGFPLGDGTANSSLTPVAVVGLTDATAITVGGHHTCALRSNGRVACWGSNLMGQLGDGTTTHRHSPVAVVGLTDATAVVGGEVHTCALRRAGHVVCWGANLYGALGDGTTVDRHSPVPVGPFP
jgi:alpha-tubulin suppressor-like RCC1 family protein